MTQAKKQRNSRIWKAHKEHPEKSMGDLGKHFKLTRGRVWAIIKAEVQRRDGKQDTEEPPPSTNDTDKVIKPV